MVQNSDWCLSFPIGIEMGSVRADNKYVQRVHRKYFGLIRSIKEDLSVVHYVGSCGQHLCMVAQWFSANDLDCIM